MVKTKLSMSGKYRIDIHSEGVDKAGKPYYAAIIMKAIRSYWEPVKQGIYLTKDEIDEYLDQ